MLYRQFEMRVPARVHVIAQVPVAAKQILSSCQNALTERRAHVIAQLQRSRFEQILYCSDGEGGRTLWRSCSEADLSRLYIALTEKAGARHGAVAAKAVLVFQGF